MPEIKEVSKKTCLQDRKRWNKLIATGEKRWLAILLGNEKMIALWLKFFKATKIREKEGAKERELKLTKKHNQEDENIFG